MSKSLKKQLLCSEKAFRVFLLISEERWKVHDNLYSKIRTPVEIYTKIISQQIYESLHRDTHNRQMLIFERFDPDTELLFTFIMGQWTSFT